jgi:SAM-dependent methyltransferase
MGEDDEQLLRVGAELAGLLAERGLQPTSSVLDVGCGYGRLALGILHATDHRGAYLGFDILHRHITWCQESITAAYPNFRFRRLDIRNERYNPEGTIDPTSAVFPADSGSVDICAVFSVFTHLYRSVVERYLAEIRRVLRPGAVAVTTWFLFDDARLSAVISASAAYPMIHTLDEATRYASDEDPLRAIAFEEGLVRTLIRQAGLEVAVLEHGTWAGAPGRVFQDLVVMRRPASVWDRVVDAVRLARRAARRLLPRSLPMAD